MADAEAEASSTTTNGEWEMIKTGDKVIRRRITHVPAPPSSNSQGTTTKPTSKQKKKLSKQQRMLRQIKAQRELEDEQHKVVGTYTNSALRNEILKYLKVLWLLITVGGLVLYFYAPEILYKWFFDSKIRLANRSLMTVYPSHLKVRKDLPLFFQSYAIATPENAKARQAVQHVAELRTVITDPGKEYNQRIDYHAWEHIDFTRQMRNATLMDEYCGEGFRAQYKGEAGLTSQKKRDDLLLWCLLAQGHHDGFVKYETKKVRSGITRARKGVAMKYVNQNRIHSDSLLLLPIHDTKDLKVGRSEPLHPTTMVAFVAMEWLRTNAGLEEKSYKRLFEEFLYEWMAKETERWDFWSAGCSFEDRQRLGETERLIATTCTERQLANDQSLAENTCCSFYDPSLKPIRKPTAMDDEDD